MKKFSVTFKSILFICAVLITITGCKKKEKRDLVYSEEVAKLVSYVTSGTISSTDEIKVEFNDPVVEEDALNKPLDGKVFSFTPSVKGNAYWKNMYTLVFQPEKELPSRKDIYGKVNLELLSDDFKERKLGSIEFRIFITGREISSFKADLILKDRNNPKILRYGGTVAFSEQTDIEQLESAATLKQGSKSVKITWKEVSDKRTFEFLSDDIERGDKTRNFTFLIEKGKLNLPEDFERDFEVTPLQEMKITGIVKEEEGKSPRLRVEFSDEIDISQDISGFISIDPQITTNISKFGSSVVIDGDFRFGSQYTLTVAEGITSRWGTKTRKKETRTVKFSDIPPQIEFVSDGFILPTSNQQKLQFYTTNLRRVHLEVKKVYNRNLRDFLRNEQVSSLKNRHNEFSNSYTGNIGVIVLNQTLEVGEEKNKWLLHEIDLKNIVKDDENGLYLVRLNFNPRDLLVDVNKDKYEYIQEFGQIYKPLIISDIGLTVKNSKNNYTVYATDIRTAQPISGVYVELYPYWDDDVIASGTTNSKGMVELSKGDYYSVEYVIATKGGQTSVMKLDEMEWNTSGFDVSGVETSYDGIRAYIYTERGVYRPGDEINLSVIARNENNTFPDRHPVQIRLFNPEGQMIYETTNSDGRDGFYSFRLKTEESAPTGNWEVTVDVGSRTFYHVLKIETVVPYKLKVEVESKSEKIKYNDQYLEFDINSRYLFGTPAAGLSAEAEIEILETDKTFAKYEDFSFRNQYTEFNHIKTSIFQGRLDTAGKAHVKWPLPSFDNVPSALIARLSVSVLEKGGRPNQNWKSMPVDPYRYYVGMKLPGKGYSYVRTGDEIRVPVILLDTEGTPVPGKELTYRIYKNTSYWWYQYESRNRFRIRFKTDRSTILVKEGKLTSKDKVFFLTYKPDERGEYLIEVQEGGYEGHKASIFLNAYPWGYLPEGDQDAGTLLLRSNKSKYFVGEEAIINFPAPDKGAVLLSIERGTEILKSEWIQPEVTDNEVNIRIPITGEMAPNSYVSIAVIQPHEQTVNDRPIRMFGILPLSVEDPDTRQTIAIEMPDELKPEQSFEVKIKTMDRKPTQFTIAVVDEGLLDITNFRTPDPWKEFFKKLRLQVRSFDLFNHIIGANKGDVFKVFSVGGDMDYRESQLSPERGRRRFKPVSMFKGPIMTDGNGEALVKFDMPNYVGSVRVMVIGARKNTYASAEKTVPVKTDLMIQTSLPRALKPGDKFDIPVTVFAMKDNIGKVEVSVTTEGPVMVTGSKSQTLTFTKNGEKDCYFTLAAKMETGQTKVTVKAKSATYTARDEADIMISPASPRIYDAQEKLVNAGEKVLFTIPDKGIKGTNRAKITLNLFPNMEFSHRLEWLIHYPYGCIEQTTSAVFPQLYLKEFMAASESKQNEIDKNINTGIDRLKRFQTSSGGFSYWPGQYETTEWGTNYAGHFMVEAKKRGYYVPDGLYSNAINYMKRQARNHSGDIMERVNRAYVLAIAGESVMSELNVIKENELKNLNNTQKWMLAAAYKLAGVKSTAENLIKNTEKKADEYYEFGGCYGSTYRDYAIILHTLVVMENMQEAELVAKEVARTLSSQYWYSTQTVGYMLLSLGKYFEGANISGTVNPNFVGYVKLPGGKQVDFDIKNKYELVLKEGFGENIELFLDSRSSITKAYATLSWDGVPLKDETADESKNISVSAEWLDENGNTINPAQLKQGTTIWGHFTVENQTSVPLIEEVALVQILPTGWEIENTRLSEESMPEWMSGLNLNREQYLDIRDDRIMWFFDLEQESCDFVVKINTVTSGEYYLPATLVEAMYNNDYKATLAGRKVVVSSR
ncbi:MAG: alpha-2-macroglobulin family protein [Bacteroidales bacterium]|nr:alpha-2-macroglobulin family protein [Bacteroidales bacterium]